MKVLSEPGLALARKNSEKGDPKASMTLAEHSLGLGLRAEAKHYYVLAAKQGSSAAAHAAAVLFEDDGQNEEAVHWLRTACRAGNKLACTRLSIAYLGGGLELERDKKKADEYGRVGEG